jgi:flagellar hook protein FlgE
VDELFHQIVSFRGNDMSSINIGASTLRAYQTALDITANNVANASTKNYQAKTANFQESPSGGVIVNISSASQATFETYQVQKEEKESSTDLNRELVNNLSYQRGFELAAKLVKVNDEILGSLIDVKA